MTAATDSEREVVLVALDGSPAAATALPAARSVATQLGAALEVLHALGDATDKAADRLRLDGPDFADALVREPCGDAVTAILDAAADPRVALVVLTTHGRTIEPGRSLGRVAEAVIAAAIRPILLVRPEAPSRPKEGAGGLRLLLVPLDGTPSTATALRPTTELAGRMGAAVDLLYVADPAQTPPGEVGSIGPPRYVDQPQHEWPQWASEIIARLARACAGCPASVPVRMFLATGDIGGAVVGFATTHAHDAIALVRRSHLEAGHARVLRAILDQTPCPILLVGGVPGEI